MDENTDFSISQNGGIIVNPLGSMYLENGGETAKGGYTSELSEGGWPMMNNSDYNTSVSLAF